jgi:broad specificity phosphatase PhoE
MIVIYETHATSLDNEAGLASGWYDVDLSEAGIRQAAELGARYSGVQLAAVYCSDLRRSRRTAEIAFAGREVTVVVDPRLRECHYGSLTRCPVAQIDAVRLDVIAVPFPEGESYEQATSRVRDWLDDARRAGGAGPVLVIGHRATHYALDHLIAGVPLRDAMAAPFRWQPGWRYEWE